MMVVRFTLAASRDLREIIQYLETLPQQPSLRIGNQLSRTLEEIAQFPRIGRVDRAQSDLAGRDVYRFVSGQYILFYSLEQQSILILGIIHGKRDYGSIMSRRHF